jgi:hypothetical protein
MLRLTDILCEDQSLSEKQGPCWKGYEMVGMKMKDGREVPNCVPIKELNGTMEEESSRDQIMATVVKWKGQDGKDHEATLKSIYGSTSTYPKGSPARVAADRVYARFKNPKPASAPKKTFTPKRTGNFKKQSEPEFRGDWDDYVGSEFDRERRLYAKKYGSNSRSMWEGEATPSAHDDELHEGEYCMECLIEVLKGEHPEQIGEAEYQGRKVPVGKPMRGDVKKFKVFVKDPSTGNIKKVNFGDKKMRIKKSNPARRKSFRARHNCDNPGPRTKARYWSCRKW